MANFYATRKATLLNRTTAIDVNFSLRAWLFNLTSVAVDSIGQSSAVNIYDSPCIRCPGAELLRQYTVVTMPSTTVTSEKSPLPDIFPMTNAPWTLDPRITKSTRVNSGAWNRPSPFPDL